MMDHPQQAQPPLAVFERVGRVARPRARLMTRLCARALSCRRGSDSSRYATRAATIRETPLALPLDFGDLYGVIRQRSKRQPTPGLPRSSSTPARCGESAPGDSGSSSRATGPRAGSPRCDSISRAWAMPTATCEPRTPTPPTSTPSTSSIRRLPRSISSPSAARFALHPRRSLLRRVLVVSRGAARIRESRRLCCLTRERSTSIRASTRCVTRARPRGAASRRRAGSVSQAARSSHREPRS